jgi:lipoyl(octanoyl) transferase
MTWAGLVPYEQAWTRQRELHAQVVAGSAPDTALLLEHLPVYTAGKRTEPWERPVDGTPVIDVDRGGKITWHGPGQLVGYPIVRLPDPVDVVAYVRRMEQVRGAAAYGCPPTSAAPNARSRRSASGSPRASRCTDSRSTAIPTSPGSTASFRAGSPTPVSRR